MDKKEKVRIEITEIWYSLMQAKTSYYYADYLFNPETKEERDYLLGAVEFQFFRTILWKNSIIEVSKLFKRNEKRSVQKFINKLRPSGEFQKLVSNELIQKWDSKILEFENVIDIVITLRDSVFAHTDIDYHETLQYNKFEANVEKLIVLTQEIITDVFYHIFDAAAMQPEKLLNDNFDILKILAKHENERRDAIIESAKKYARKMSKQ